MIKNTLSRTSLSYFEQVFPVTESCRASRSSGIAFQNNLAPGIAGTKVNRRSMAVKKKVAHRILIHWYRKYGRQFPWRTTRDPYVILVAEVMLQQTQTRRVEEKLPQFLARFPSLGVLGVRVEAASSELGRDGYNRRAISLHECAKEIVKVGGKFPQNVEQLMCYSGIGRYTASALLCSHSDCAFPSLTSTSAGCFRGWCNGSRRWMRSSACARYGTQRNRCFPEKTITTGIRR